MFAKGWARLAAVGCAGVTVGLCHGGIDAPVPVSLIDDVIFIGRGLGATLILTGGGLLLGGILAVGMTALRQMGIAGPLWTGIISLIRGTPLLLQLGLVYYTVPLVTGIRLGVMGAGILAFGVNSAAYLAQTLQGGIQTVPRGQFEAGQTLAIPRYPLWRDIVVPQVIRIVQPSLINEMIALLKETALISILGGGDLMNQVNIMAAERFSFFRPLCIAGAYYYGLVLAIEAFGRFLERKQQHGDVA